MTISNGDMPAMPLPNDATGRPYVFDDYDIQNKRRAYGLTKREQFAMAAMQGILSSPLETDKLSHAANKSMKVFVVEQAVAIADALLAELGKAGGE